MLNCNFLCVAKGPKFNRLSEIDITLMNPPGTDNTVTPHLIFHTKLPSWQCYALIKIKGFYASFGELATNRISCIKFESKQSGQYIDVYI